MIVHISNIILKGSKSRKSSFDFMIFYVCFKLVAFVSSKTIANCWRSQAPHPAQAGGILRHVEHHRLPATHGDALGILAAAHRYTKGGSEVRGGGPKG